MLRRLIPPAICMAAVLAALTAPAPAQRTPEEVAEFKAHAVELLSDRNYDSKRSAHYLVRTDDPRVDVVKISAFLEGAYRHFEEFFGGLTELKEPGEPLEFYLFFSRFKYHKLYEGLDGQGVSGSIGHYRGDLEVVAAHTDTVGPGDFPGLLSHEAAHHLVHTRLYGRDLKFLSAWVTEGLGEYFGFTLMDRKGRFRTGEIGGQQVMLLRDTASSRAILAREQLSDFKSLVKKAEPGFLDDLVHLDSQSIFYSDEPVERYTASWVLVHFLLHGRDGALAGPFVEFIREDARGNGGGETLYRLLGMDGDELEAAFLEYAKKLKAK